MILPEDPISPVRISYSALPLALTPPSETANEPPAARRDVVSEEMARLEDEVVGLAVRARPTAPEEVITTAFRNWFRAR